MLSGGVPSFRVVPCVPALADGPLRGFREVCRACLCLLGLSWLQANCAGSVGCSIACSLSPDTLHLRACPIQRLYPSWYAILRDSREISRDSRSRPLPEKRDGRDISSGFRSEVAMPVVRRSFSRGCSVSLVVTPGCSFPTLWRSGILGACVMRLWSHVVAPVFRELLCLDVLRCCFRI
ncbi:hypothetical protein Taro_010867, partial [Colocasia esculenta]|nr:hypothetical protein [Colocasia esculenta]